MTTRKEREKQEAIDWLRERIKPGDTVYCILRHVSSSGMTRDISTHIVIEGEVVPISTRVADAVGYRTREVMGSYAIRVGGCGMDMGFSIVYELGRVLFPEGFVPADCGLLYGRNRAPATELDTDGGYALKYHWV
jgi:hypothetical protein